MRCLNSGGRLAATLGLSLVVALAGCQRRRLTCETAVSGAMDRMVASARAKMPAPVAANVARVVPQMKRAIIASCVADHWSPAMLECLAKANGRDQLDACDAMLTPQQRQNEHKRNDELLRAAVQPLQQPDPEREHRDPHAGLGIPPAEPQAPAGSAAPGPAGSGR